MAKYLHYGSVGPKVVRLQALLNEQHYKPLGRKLKADGEMGPLTCSAVHKVKKWMGYPKLDVDFRDQIAGDFFMNILDGKRALPEAYKKRRQALVEKAKAAARRKPMRLKVLGFAKADLGIVEKQPNIIKYNEWWNGQADNAPYCVRAGSYWHKKAGSKIVDPHKGLFEGTDYLLGFAKRGKLGLDLTSDPDPGDSFVIDFDGKADPDHFGLFVEDLGGGLFKSIEANADIGGGRQGVGYHERAYRNCWFIQWDD